MRQYQEVKAQYPDCLLFFRLGDFYELFYEDAQTASRELNIVLTARDGGKGNKVPMCGVPFHSANNYLARLIEKGYKIAICEQLEDPKSVKGLVKRGVVRVVTPGTVVEENMLDEKQHNYLAACWQESQRGTKIAFGLAYVDISSGEFLTTEFSGEEAEAALVDELCRIHPAELILQEELYRDEGFRAHFWDRSVGSFSLCPEEAFIKNNYRELLQTHFRISSLESLGLGERKLAALAAEMILFFLQHTQKRSLDYIDKLQVYDCGSFMFLDAATRRNLELTATLRNNKRRGSLLWVLDDTLSSMGSRLLKKWLESPMLSAETINLRLDAVGELLEQPAVFQDLREELKGLYDLPRLISRVCYGNAGPRDLTALKQTAFRLPGILQLLSQLKSPLYRVFFDSLDALEDIYSLIDAAISENAPLSPKESGVIRQAYNSEVDELRSLSGSTKELLLQMEARERERTGIKTLKISYNKVFGYYIEISRSRAAEAPAEYVRKQTLVNGERFITDELKQLETRILSAGERLADLEYGLFLQIREHVAAAADRILQSAEVLANLDVLQSLASVAQENNYCRPVVNDEAQIIIKDG
ncbi:MAG: DNA mismatch repair protein MutS, partial [Bacillota bacterium]|nr:DNA mismatch repair protein MutS [Bacillota bacterium]